MPRFEIGQIGQRLHERYLHEVVGVGEIAGALGETAVGPPAEAGEEPTDQLVTGAIIKVPCPVEEHGG